jgi:hypothetical protein
MRGGRREGAGRKKKPDHLRRELVTIRLPQWIIDQRQLFLPVNDNYNSRFNMFNLQVL